MSDINLLNKIQNFTAKHCYQYQRRLDTLEEDKQILGWSDEFIDNIDINDFEFENITLKKIKMKQRNSLNGMSGWVQLVHIQHIGLLLNIKVY